MAGGGPAASFGSTAELVRCAWDQFHQIHGLAAASAAGAYKAVPAPQKAMPWVTGGGAGALAGGGAGALAGAGGGASQAAVVTRAPAVTGAITSGEPGRAGSDGKSGDSSGALLATQPGTGSGSGPEYSGSAGHVPTPSPTVGAASRSTASNVSVGPDPEPPPLCR